MNKENTKTVKTRRVAAILSMAIMLIFLTGCSLTGNRPVLTVEGSDITLGTTTPDDWEGFELNMVGSQNAIGSLDANSWLIGSMAVHKDGSTYAFLDIYNPSSSSKRYVNCPVYKVRFLMHSEENPYWAENNILVNGIDFFGMDSDEVKEAMQDYELTLENEDTGKLTYERGNYEYKIEFNETTGIVDAVTIEMGIQKGYS